MPYHRLFHINFLKFKESQIHGKTYDDKYVDFPNDYERANPMTKIEGEMRYLDKLEEKNKINKKEKDRRKKKIKEENPIKLYRKHQRVNQNTNIQDLNNLLSYNEKDEENINCIMFKTTENDQKERQMVTKKKPQKFIRISNNNESSMNSNYLMNQG